MKTNARDLLMDVLRQRGNVEPETVVAVAADPGHPLHRYFTWDNNEAAHRYRLVQAEKLLRTVKVTREVVETGTREVRVIHERGFPWVPQNEHEHEEDDETHQGSGRRWFALDEVEADPKLAQMYAAEVERHFRTMQARFHTNRRWRELIEAEHRRLTAA